MSAPTIEPGGATDTVAPEPEVYEFPASSAQSRLLMLERLRPGTAQYNVPLAFAVSGPFDATSFATALDRVVARHEALRTTLRIVGDEAVQTVAADPRVTPRIEDTPSEAAAAAALARDAALPFDLERGPLLRCAVYRLSTENHHVLLSLHHAVCDGWSLLLLVEELAAEYRAARTGVPADLPEPSLQFPDYSQWQRQRLATGKLARAIEYWRDSLADVPLAPALPTDRPRPPVQTTASANEQFILPGDLRERMSGYARSAGTTEYAVMFAAFNVLISRITGRTDVVVTTPVSGRDHPDLQRVVGPLTNTLALRTDLSGPVTFAALLGRVRGRLREVQLYQDAPFETVVDAVVSRRDPSHDALAEIGFTFDDSRFELDLGADLTVERRPVPLYSAKCDLMLYTEILSGDMRMLFDYRPNLFDAATIRHWIRSFLVLLDRLLAHPHQPVDSLDLLDHGQLAQVLGEWNGTPTGAPPGLTGDLIALQAAARPEATALVCGDTALTYRVLLERADRLARRLRAAGVGPETPVGVCLGRTVEAAVAALAVLRAGGVYLPLDPGLPAARLRWIIEDCDARLVLAGAETGWLPTALAHLGVEVPLLAPGATDFVAAPKPFREPTDREATADNGAYLIFTSGSTGVPKGVLVEHRALANLVTGLWPRFGLTAHDRVLQHFSLAFDASLGDLFGAWAAGAELHLARDEERLGEALYARLAQSRITFSALPPAALMSLPCPPGALPELRTVGVGGEACPAELVRRWTTPHRRVHNGYGPTETAVIATNGPLTPDEQVTIGRPGPNVRAYVLDARLRPVPVGVVGELYLAGAGLARGYLRAPGRTAERFVADPFGPAGTRMYRSGDLAKFDAAGRLYCLGRTDGQVKLRGFRIELGEIEAALASHPRVAAAAALIGGGPRLLGYAVPARPARPPAYAELREWLADRLPAYMIPEDVVIIEELPVSGVGKVDRDRLPEPPAKRPDPLRPYAGPATPTERRVAEIWSRVLEIDRIGRHDNFFDLGGNSSRLLAVHAALGEQARASGDGRAGPPLVDLFRVPDVAALARRLDNAAPGAAPAADRVAAAARRHGDERRRRLADRAAAAKQGSKAIGVDTKGGQR